jgi:hypothetical protein
MNIKELIIVLLLTFDEWMIEECKTLGLVIITHIKTIKQKKEKIYGFLQDHEN